MTKGVTLVSGYRREQDGSFTVELKGAGFERERDAAQLVSVLREALGKFAARFSGVTAEKFNAGSADEAIAVFQSRDATKQ